MSLRHLLILASLAIAPLAATAQPVRLGVDYWLSTGESEWEISGADGFFAGDAFRSELTWEDLDSPMALLRADVPLADGIRIEGLYGFGDIDDGTNRDRDWVTVPEFGIDDELVSESIAETDGDLRLADVMVAIRVAQSGGAIVEAIGGYLTFDEDLRDRNGVQTIDISAEKDVPFAFDGLDSTFNFSWQAWKVGARVSFPIVPQLHASVLGAFLVGVTYEGEGFWNLRAGPEPGAFREQSPNFEQEADGGTGRELVAELRWSPSPRFALRGGYRVLSMSAEDGDDITYFSDGSAGRSDLDNVETTRRGFFAGAELVF